MTETKYVPFLVNSRSSSLVHLIDAFQFTDSELVDLYMAIAYRLKDLINLDDAAITGMVETTNHELQQSDSDRIVSTEYLKELRHDY
jgi:hypothetical protein